MFNVGTAELLVILLVALLVLGPNKLPDAARQVGRALGELRRLSSGFQAEMRDALREPVEGKPASGAATTSVTNDGDGALSSPKPGDAGAETTATPPPVSDGSGTSGAEVQHAPPPAQTERGNDPGGGDGGTTTAPTGRGGTATSPPAPDAGTNGSTPA